MPRTPSGKRRPCGTLLQLVVAILSEMQSIGGSVETVISVAVEHPVIPPIFAKIAYHFMGHQQAGSLTGAVPSRKDIGWTQR